MNLNNVYNQKTYIHHLGPFVVDEHHAHNSYLIQLEDSYILIDIPPIQVFDLLQISISKYTEISRITHLVIQHMTMSTASVIIELIDEGFRGVIITNRYFSRQLTNLNLPINIILIEDYQNKIIIGTKNVLSFIPMVFLPLPHMFMTYFVQMHTLFSATLFSSFYDDSATTINSIKKSIFSYHKFMMPSSEYLKPPLSRVNSLLIKQIYPLMGYLIDESMIDEIIKFESELDFYNSTQVFKYNEINQKNINFIEIINHLINRLQNYYSRIEILNTFIGSPFSLTNDTLELRNSSLAGYKLYNAFFDLIYIKKGTEWLTLLEPIIIQYHNNHDIELPSIYSSLFSTLKMEKEALSERKAILESDLSILKTEIEQKSDQMKRCPITHLYLESVLRDRLRQDSSHQLESKLINGLLLVQIDKLYEINKKYGKDIGDESIRNIAYILEQNKSSHTEIYKQNGPGILIYEYNTTVEQLQKDAISFRNAINDSNLFIEKLSASISIVSENEILVQLSQEEKIESMFKLLEQRISFARNQGKGEIVDFQTSVKGSIEGSILLVDEDEVSSNMLYRIFKRINYDVKIAKSASEAIQIIEKHQIDIVVSEINLSKIDGFSLKQSLNNSKDYKNIPFIMVSHNKTVENIRRGNTLDVDFILEKPIIPEELVGIVKRFKDRKYNS